MMNMLSKYDNMHKNGISYAFNYINNHAIVSIICMLSVLKILHVDYALGFVQVDSQDLYISYGILD